MRSDALKYQAQSLDSNAMRDGHGEFLRRNGAAVSALLEQERFPDHSERHLVTELFIFVAAQRPAALLDGHALRGLDRLFAPRRTRGKPLAYWRRHLDYRRSLPPRAAERVAALAARLSVRKDFPELRALTEWGIHRWEALFSSIGMDPREARTFLALVLDRKHMMPAGPEYERVYRRIGIAVDQQGMPVKKAFYPEDSGKLKWQLASLAFNRCTDDIDPGGKACAECPIRLFCKAGRSARAPPKRTQHEFIDMFAGGGGLSLGFTWAGFRERAAVEVNEHSVDTLYFNHPELGTEGLVVQDVRKLLADKDFVKTHRGVDLVVGGPPCQPFSMARRHTRPDRTDPRRFLFRPFVQLAARLQPRIIIMENVPGLVTANRGKLLRHVLKEFDTVGFSVSWRCLTASDYGVPQHRRRLFFVAVNRNLFPRPTATLERFWAELEALERPNFVTVREALNGIPRVKAGEGGLAVRKNVRGVWTGYNRVMGRKTAWAFNHEARAHNARDLRIFRCLRRGETAESLDKRIPKLIPYQLQSFGDKYRKLRANSPGPTIPAHLHRDANSFVHPFVPRGITCREAARLQSFPDDYLFLGGFGPAFIQTGNAVPPLLARAVGHAARAILDEGELQRRAPLRRRRHGQDHTPTR